MLFVTFVSNKRKTNEKQEINDLFVALHFILNVLFEFQLTTMYSDFNFECSIDQ